jgi:hypothetical protein
MGTKMGGGFRRPAHESRTHPNTRGQGWERNRHGLASRGRELERRNPGPHDVMILDSQGPWPGMTAALYIQ